MSGMNGGGGRAGTVLRFPHFVSMARPDAPMAAMANTSVQRRRQCELHAALARPVSPPSAPLLAGIL